MTNHSIPAPEDLTICFAHVAYQLEMIFARRQTDLQNFQVWTAADLAARLPQADVLVISGFWQNDLLNGRAAPAFHPVDRRRYRSV